MWSKYGVEDDRSADVSSSSEASSSDDEDDRSADGDADDNDDEEDDDSQEEDSASSTDRGSKRQQAILAQHQRRNRTPKSKQGRKGKSRKPRKTRRTITDKQKKERQEEESRASAQSGAEGAFKNLIHDDTETSELKEGTSEWALMKDKIWNECGIGGYVGELTRLKTDKIKTNLGQEYGQREMNEMFADFLKEQAVQKPNADLNPCGCVALNTSKTDVMAMDVMTVRGLDDWNAYKGQHMVRACQLASLESQMVAKVPIIV